MRISHTKRPAWGTRWLAAVIGPAMALTAGGCAVTPRPPRGGSRAFLYENTFEQHEPGVYSARQLEADWTVFRSATGIDEGRAAIVDYGADPVSGRRFGKVLRVTYPGGAWGRDGMVQFRHALGGTFEEIYAEYWFRLPTDFEFGKGGKLPGPAGGSGNTGGDRPDGFDGWSARMMWRGDYLVSYVYHPNQPDGAFGENMLWRRIKAGGWYRALTYIRMNAVGARDGIIRGWLNGELVLERTNLEFRRTEELGVDHYLFSTFYGGADSTWAPRGDTVIDFDELRIWTTR